MIPSVNEGLTASSTGRVIHQRIIMETHLEVFTTSSCTRCPKLVEYLENNNVDFIKRIIDEDPDAETDAIMNGILSAPALKKGDIILRVKQIFDANGAIIAENVNEIAGIAM